MRHFKVKPIRAIVGSSMAFLYSTFLFSTVISAGALRQTKAPFEDKFCQLDETLPTPNVFRNAAGELGHEYWQQQGGYKMKVNLD